MWKTQQKTNKQGTTKKKEREKEKETWELSGSGFSLGLQVTWMPG